MMPTEAAEPRGPEPTDVDWVEVLSTFWVSRRLIVKLTGTFTIISIIVSFVLPTYYRSSTTLLPETEKGKVSMLGGLSDLAALAGVNVGADATVAKLYPTIIESEAVLRNVIYTDYSTEKFSEPANLIKFWGISEDTREREYEIAIKRLREDLEVSMDNKTSVVTLAIEAREPQLSADILNKITNQLDEFIRTKKRTNASEQRKWVEGRLVEIRKDLEKSENILREFRERNRRITDSPKLLLEQGRLMREVDINSTIYLELKKQYELVKIEEIKNIPIINVMDSARPAARREHPKRTLIVVSSSIFSFLAVLGYVFVRLRYATRLIELSKGLWTGKPPQPRE